MNPAESRRMFVTLAGASLALGACRKQSRLDPEPLRSPLATSASAAKADKKGDSDEQNEDVGAVEDLMREHGVIRRILVVYRESATRLRAKPGSALPQALQQAATLM